MKKQVKGQISIKEAIIAKSPKKEIIDEDKDLFNEEFTCPYCLLTEKLVNFRLSIHKGYSTKKYRCPECGNTMLKDTLMKQRSVEEYAKWLYNSIIESGKWREKGQVSTYEKLEWNDEKRRLQFFDRLKKMGISSKFWEAWKQAKKDRIIVKSGYNEDADYLDYQSRFGQTRIKDEDREDYEDYVKNFKEDLN